MIGRKLRRFAAHVRAKPPEIGSDQRAFIRVAYLLAFKREPDEASYRRHEDALLNGQSRADTLRELLNQPESTAFTEDVESAVKISAVSVRPEDADHLIRLAFQSLLRRDADATHSMAYREAFDRGTTILDLLSDIVRSEEFNIKDRVRPEDADDLIRLAFRSLLRRDPDLNAYVGYREGFARGTTFLDLIRDVTNSEEYQIVEEQIKGLLAATPQVTPPTLDHSVVGDMHAALTLLEMRLAEKGCLIQLGAMPAGAVDGASAHKRMRNLMVTLSLVDRL